jgi:hypothetical protein
VGAALRSHTFSRKIQSAFRREVCRGLGPYLARRYISSSGQVPSKNLPFDILFCGSDAFSTASLKALLGAKGDSDILLTGFRADKGRYLEKFDCINTS